MMNMICQLGQQTKSAWIATRKPVEDVLDRLKLAKQERTRAKNCLNFQKAKGYATIKQQKRLELAEQNIKAIIESEEYKTAQAMAVVVKTEEQKQMKRERDKRYHERNKERLLAKNREIAAAYRQTDAYKQWRIKTRDRKVRWQSKRRRELGCKPRLHDHHVRAFVQYKKKKDKEEFKRNVHDAHVQAKKALNKTELWRWRYKNDPAFNARERIRNQIKKMAQKHPRLGCLIRDAINRNGESRTIHQVLGYSVRELKAHLEKQFTKGMSWDEFLKGNIHIDHIIPKSVFDLTEEEDISRCWAMSNLRPLWAKDNLRKGARIEHVI